MKRLNRLLALFLAGIIIFSCQGNAIMAEETDPVGNEAITEELPATEEDTDGQQKNSETYADVESENTGQTDFGASDGETADTVPDMDSDEFVKDVSVAEEQEILANADDGNAMEKLQVSEQEDADAQEVSEETEQEMDPDLQENVNENEDAYDIAEGVIGYLLENRNAIMTRSFDNSSYLAMNSSRYDKFALLPTTDLEIAFLPNLGMGIKWVNADGANNVDSAGKWRNVYCLEFKKTSPEGHTYIWSGWTNRKVTYAIYYGATYWGETCRYEPYSTGYWDMDYFVTAVAVHILNEEFTLNTAIRSINASNATATAAEKALAIDRITKIVNDANDPANYASFDSNGWFDKATNSLTLSGYSNTWTESGGNVYSGGWVTPTFNSYYGYDDRMQITSYTINAPEGVTVERDGNATYAPFRLRCTAAQYREWQKTGKTITVTVTAKIPQKWGVGIYRNSVSADYQNIGLLTYESSSATYSFTANATFTIPKVISAKGKVTVTKKDSETGTPLKGAQFQVYEWNGKSYANNKGLLTDNGNGTYTSGLFEWSETNKGKFKITETANPTGYSGTWSKEFTISESGGNNQQFAYNVTNDPIHPKANVTIKKVDKAANTSLSGAVFTVYEWDSSINSYKDSEYQTLAYSTEQQNYHTNTPLEKTMQNLGKFKIVETQNPDGYYGKWEKEITITGANGTTQSFQYTAQNIHLTTLKINKTLSEDDIWWAHGNPTFTYKITGIGADGKEHTYYRTITFTPEKVDADGLTLSTEVKNIPGGEYTVTELKVSRFALTNVTAQTDNVSILKAETGNDYDGIKTITADITVDLNKGNGEMTFYNRRVTWDKYSHTDCKQNSFSLKVNP